MKLEKYMNYVGMYLLPIIIAMYSLCMKQFRFVVFRFRCEYITLLRSRRTNAGNNLINHVPNEYGYSMNENKS